MVRKEVEAASLRLVFIENCAGKVMHPFIDDAGVSVDWWNPVRRDIHARIVFLSVRGVRVSWWLIGEETTNAHGAFKKTESSSLVVWRD